MSDPHLTLRQLERIDAEGPTPAEQGHLDACPRCRIERRLFASMAQPPSDPTWQEASRRSLTQTLERGRALVRETMEERAALAPSEPPAPAPASAPPPGRGLAVAPWRHVRTLGRGGMGVVYLGIHDETGQRAAVKTITRPHPGLAAAMRREVAALAALDHPGVVEILDHGVTEGRPWMAMAHLPGPTLRQQMPASPTARASSGWESGWQTGWQTGGASPDDLGFDALWGAPDGDHPGPAADPALSPADALTVVRRLCDALAYLHGEGIVHRDLKPENILLQPDLTPVIIDFGLVARTAGPDGRAVLDVRAGISGTAAYMAPEQAQGELGDARADLYALGCILYEIAVGRPPFVGPTPEGVLRQHLDAPPAPPSWLGHAVAPGLEALILRLLSKDPTRRFGYAEDVAAALEALGARPAARPRRPARSHVYPSGLVGRRRTLKALRDAVTDRSGPAVVLLTGESGVGKTRLASAFAKTAARKGFAVLGGECSRSGLAADQPLDALHAVLHAVFDRVRAAGPAEVERVVGVQGPVLAAVAPAVASLPGQQGRPSPPPLPPAAGRRRLLGAVTRLLVRFAQRQPLLLVLDDLQWAGDLLRSWLGALERADPGRRIRVLGTVRTDEQPAALGALPEPARVLSLGRMGADEVGEMVRQMLALPEPPAALVRDITAHSEGNPFFVAETLRSAVSEGLLTRSAAGVWRIEGGRWAGMGLPDSLRALLRRRLDGLSVEARRVAEIAAVLGRGVDRALLAAVEGAEVGPLDAALGELERREVLHPTGSAAWRFAHETLREEAELGLPAATRAALHHRAAEHLSAQGAGDAQPARLGHHWAGAGEPDRARPCFEAAARRAVERYDYGEAADLYERAMGCAQGAARAALRLERLQAALYRRGHRGEALQEALAVRADAQACGDAALDARAAAWQAQLLSETGALEQAAAVAAAALPRIEALGDPLQVADLLATMGINAARLGRATRARALHERVVAIYREQGEDLLLGKSLSYLAGPMQSSGRLDDAFALETEALTIIQRAGDRYYEGIIHSNLAALHELSGRWEQAHAGFQQALAIHREVGNLRSEGLVLSCLGEAHLARGELEQARRYLDASLPIHRECDNPELRWWSVSLRGRVALLLGEVEAARSLLRRADERQAALGLHLDRVETRRHLAELALLGDRETERAASLLDAALASAREHDSAKAIGQCLCSLGHVALAEGRRPDAILEELDALQQRSAERGAAALARAVARFDRGEPLVAGWPPDALPERLGGDRAVSPRA